MAVVTNGEEEAIPLATRAAVTPVESNEYDFSAKKEGAVIVVFTDVNVTLKVIPRVQDDFRQPVIERAITAGTTHFEAFTFKTGNFKIEVTPASQPNNFGAAVRTIDVVG